MDYMILEDLDKGEGIQVEIRVDGCGLDQRRSEGDWVNCAEWRESRHEEKGATRDRKEWEDEGRGGEGECVEGSSGVLVGQLGVAEGFFLLKPLSGTP